MNPWKRRCLPRRIVHTFSVVMTLFVPATKCESSSMDILANLRETAHCLRGSCSLFVSLCSVFSSLIVVSYVYHSMFLAPSLTARRSDGPIGMCSLLSTASYGSPWPLSWWWTSLPRSVIAWVWARTLLVLLCLQLVSLFAELDMFRCYGMHRKTEHVL